MKRILAVITILLASWILSASAVLLGDGESFPKDAINSWISNSPYESGASVAYPGSDNLREAVEKLKTGEFDYVGTDMPLALDDPESFAHIPSLLSAVTICYNLPDFQESLKLTADAVAGIFSGSITHWQDSVIKGNNPTLTADSYIRVVTRSDPSTTAYELNSYLYNMVSNRAIWTNSSGMETPKVTGFDYRRGGSNLAKYVKSTNYSIGYCKKRTAELSGLKMAALKNRAGLFVTPSHVSLNSAAISFDGFRTLDWANINIGTSSMRETAYPGTRFSFFVVNRQHVTTELSLFLYYCNSDFGQTVIPNGYVAIDTRVRENVNTLIADLTGPINSAENSVPSRLIATLIVFLGVPRQLMV